MEGVEEVHQLDDRRLIIIEQTRPLSFQDFEELGL